MASYPAQPSPFIRSGWVASQLIPNPEYHASALTFLGGNNPRAAMGFGPGLMGGNNNPQAALGFGPGFMGGATPASNPQVSGVPNVSGGVFQTPPASLGGNVQGGSNFPAWMTSLLSQMGISNPTGSAANQPSFLPKGQPALTQQASQAPAGSGFNTPQFWSTAPKKKKKGLFDWALDLSPGSPTLFT